MFRSVVIVREDNPAPVDPGPAPMQQWIRIDRLVIDDTYQRDLKRDGWAAVRRIAARFRWSRFSPVFVAPVEGGLFAIIDGQHRTHAAAMCGFEEVPCNIVQMSRQEQAESFAAVNGAVTKVTSLHLFKASMEAGEPRAVQAAEAAKAAGCRLMTYNASDKTKRPGEIYGPAAFMKLIDQRTPERVTAALTLMMAAEGYQDNADVWASGILVPLVSALASDPAFCAGVGAAARLEQIDIWELLDQAEKEMARRRRLGLPSPSKREMLEQAILKAMTEGGAA